MKFPLVFVVSLHLWYLILLVRGFASLAAGPAQDPRNRILWALPKGTVLRGLGWGGGRGSGGSKKKKTTMEEKVPRLLRLSCSGQGSFDVVSISLCIIWKSQIQFLV